MRAVDVAHEHVELLMPGVDLVVVRGLVGDALEPKDLHEVALLGLQRVGVDMGRERHVVGGRVVALDEDLVAVGAEHGAPQ